MTAFTDAYRDLLIKQYWDKLNARAEIELQAGGWEAIRDIYAGFITEFDLDTATGDRLDLIGEIVGITRLQISEVGRIAAPVSDDQFRFFIQLRIAVNVATAMMVSDDRITLQDVIRFAFPESAYLDDHQDMTLSLHIEGDFDTELTLAMIRLGLLPKPHAVGYRYVLHGPVSPVFGFSEYTLTPSTTSFLLSDGDTLLLSDGDTLDVTDLVASIVDYSGIDGFSELGDVPLVGGAFTELFEV